MSPKQPALSSLRPPRERYPNPELSAQGASKINFPDYGRHPERSRHLPLGLVNTQDARCVALQKALSKAQNAAGAAPGEALQRRAAPQ